MMECIIQQEILDKVGFLSNTYLAILSLNIENIKICNKNSFRVFINTTFPILEDSPDNQKISTLRRSLSYENAMLAPIQIVRHL